jgi:hypothetical protein
MTTYVSIIADDSREIKRARVTVGVNESGTYDIEFKGATVTSNLREDFVLDMIKTILARQEVR